MLQGSQYVKGIDQNLKGNSMITPSMTQVNPWVVEVLSTTPVYNEGNVKAYANIRVNGFLEIDSLKVVQQAGQRAWVAMPDNVRSLPEKRPVLRIYNNDQLKEAIKQAVLSAWEGR